MGQGCVASAATVDQETCPDLEFNQFGSSSSSTDWTNTVVSMCAKALTKWVIKVEEDDNNDSLEKNRVKLLLAKDTEWHFRSLFVVEATFFNFSVAVLLIFFWIINRQTHIRPTKGSKIIHKNDGQEEDDEHDTDDSDLSAENVNGASNGNVSQQQNLPTPTKASQKEKRRNTYMALEGFKVEADDDEDDDMLDLSSIVDDESAAVVVTDHHPKPDVPTEVKVLSDEQKKKIHLLGVVKKMKIFSYLNEEAYQICMEQVESIPIPKGEYLFHRNSFDGSLYAVASGLVRVRFHDFQLPETEPSDAVDEAETPEYERILGMTAGPGDVLTGLLALVIGLIHQERDESSPLLFSKDISAMAISDQVHVIRVPPQCFVRILHKFPADVYRIAQTVFCRVQRVTLQILVKTLGLRKELLTDPQQQVNDSPGWTESDTWECLQAVLGHDEEDETTATSSSSCSSEPRLSGDQYSSSLNDAKLVFSMQLGIPAKDSESMDLLKSCSLISLQKGDALLGAGVATDSCYLLLRGSMDLGIWLPKEGTTSPNNDSLGSWTFHKHMNLPHGALVGEFECFSGEPSMFSSRCLTACTLLKIPKHVYDGLMVRHPHAMVSSLDSFLRMISPVVHLLNWTSDWMHVQAAEEIVRRGERCDSMFVVLNGRLRASTRKGVSSKYSPTLGMMGSSSRNNNMGRNRQQSPEEYGRGKIVGEVGCLLRSTWPCDIYAIRKSEIARVPMRILLVIIRQYPAAGLHFARSIASHVESMTAQHHRRGGGGSGGRRINQLGRSKDRMSSPPSLMPSYGLRLATIAVVPLTKRINLSKFCAKLVSAFGEIAPSKLLSKSIVLSELKEKTFKPQNAMHDLKMTRLCANMEENNRLVIYQADRKYTWWTRLCIQQADRILLVVDAKNAPEENRVEQSLAWAFESMEVQIDLVVVGSSDNYNGDEEEDYWVEDDNDDDNMNVSDQLNNWSEQREWISGHHLVRLPFSRHENDFCRMCRRLVGRSVGLVLGAGGARGMAHLGVIRALHEAGVTVDLVGGTSQGAYCGALFARNPDDLDALMKSCRDMASQMSSVRAKLFDLTLPLTSIFSGARFNQGIRKSLGKLRIQDLVLNFFCISVDLQKQW
jgi:lysophospholipid hydrolase